jgi:hypothetical protein
VTPPKLRTEKGDTSVLAIAASAKMIGSADSWQDAKGCLIPQNLRRRESEKGMECQPYRSDQNLNRRGSYFMSILTSRTHKEGVSSSTKLHGQNIRKRPKKNQPYEDCLAMEAVPGAAAPAMLFLVQKHV